MSRGRANRPDTGQRWTVKGCTSAEILTLTVLIMLTLVLLMIMAQVPPTDQVPPIGDEESYPPKHQKRWWREKMGETWIEVISWHPRAFVYHNFLSNTECKHLIDLAEPYLKESSTGPGSSYRTINLGTEQDDIVADIEDRIANFAFVPIDHSEAIQVLNYNIKQTYGNHFDRLNDNKEIQFMGQRIATFLMYLSNVEEGGETIFPNAVGARSSELNLSDCAKIKNGIVVKPKMGDALLFWSTKPDGTDDLTSLHASCPVIRGNKWSSTKWLHNKSQDECLLTVPEPSKERSMMK